MSSRDFQATEPPSPWLCLTLLNLYPLPFPDHISFPTLHGHPAELPEGFCPSPDTRVCNVKLNQPNILEMLGASDPLVGYHRCQKGL